MKEVHHYYTPRLIFILLLTLFPVLIVADEGSIGNIFGSLSTSLGKKFGLAPERKAFLEPDSAFIFTATITDSDKILAYWSIAEGYYLYKDKFDFKIVNNKESVLGKPQFPQGKMKQDETFGLMEVFYHEVEVKVPIQLSTYKESSLVFEAHYQGCADEGLCYPMIKKQSTLVLPDKDH